MDEGVVRMYAEMLGIGAELTGMQLDNYERVRQDQSPAFDAGDFYDMADRYNRIAERLREEI